MTETCQHRPSAAEADPGPRARIVRRHRASPWRLALGTVGVVAVSTSLSAAGLSRDTLWSVEQTCLFNHRATGSPFPCLEIDDARGTVVLRAPFERSHIVLMPSIAISGIEDARLRRADAPNYLKDAWDARHYVEDGLGRPLAWNDIGLTVNSAATRSQDQLHIHVDCINAVVRTELQRQQARFPVDRWQPDGFEIWRHRFWVRRLDGASLAGVNVFAEVANLPGFLADPSQTTLAVVGLLAPDGKPGFALLARRTDPTFGARQFTGESLEDHRCEPSWPPRR